MENSATEKNLKNEKNELIINLIVSRKPRKVFIVNIRNDVLLSATGWIPIHFFENEVNKDLTAHK